MVPPVSTLLILGGVLRACTFAETFTQTFDRTTVTMDPSTITLPSGVRSVPTSEQSHQPAPTPTYTDDDAPGWIVVSVAEQVKLNASIPPWVPNHVLGLAKQVAKEFPPNFTGLPVDPLPPWAITALAAQLTIHGGVIPKWIPNDLLANAAPVASAAPSSPPGSSSGAVMNCLTPAAAASA
jgi:hypothetical protein